MKSRWSKRYYKENIIGLIIVFLPYAMLLHLFYEMDTTTLDFFGVEYHHKVSGNQVFVWHFLKKTSAIALLSIWFLQAEFWWKYFILAPAFPYVFTLVILFTVGYEESPTYIEQYGIPWGLTILYVLLMVLAKQNVRNTHVLKNDLGVSNHISFLKPNLFLYKKLKSYFSQLKQQKSIETNSSYLNKILYANLLVEKTLLVNNEDIKIGFKQQRQNTINRLIAVSLLLMPLVFYMYRVIPEGISVYSFLNLTVQKNGFLELRSLVSP